MCLKHHRRATRSALRAARRTTSFPEPTPTSKRSRSAVSAAARVRSRRPRGSGGPLEGSRTFHYLAHVFPGNFLSAADRLGRTERHGRPRGSDSFRMVREVRVGGAAGARPESLTGRRGREGKAEPMGASPRRNRARPMPFWTRFQKPKTNAFFSACRVRRGARKKRKRVKKKPSVGELARFFFFFFSRERGSAARVEGTAATTRTDRAFRAFAPLADPRRWKKKRRSSTWRRRSSRRTRRRCGRGAAKSLVRRPSLRRDA